MGNQRKNGKRGYRLHDERIAYSGGIGSMRTIKYELDGRDKQVVIDALVEDSRRFYGALNFSDFLANPDTPSLLGFWVKALSLGFVFANQNSIEREFKKYLGILTREEQVFAKISDKFRENLAEKAWIDFVFTPQRGVEKKTAEQLKQMIMRLAKKDGDAEIFRGISEEYAENVRTGWTEKEKAELFGVREIPAAVKQNLALSFAVDPNFAKIDETDRTKFFDEIIAFYEGKVGENLAKIFLGVGNNGGYFNGLFGGLFGLLRENRTEEIARQIDEVYGFDNFREVYDRLEILREYTDKLGEPKFVAKWSDYRSDFNGTIESWYSNRAGKGDIAHEQLASLDKLLGEISRKLDEAGESEIREGILAETVELIEGREGKISRKFSEELESYLATLRTDLNYIAQQNVEVHEKLKEIRGAKDENGESRPIAWQRELGRHIQSSPLFFGENKRALWEQLRTLKAQIREEIDALIADTDVNFADYEIQPRQVESLAFLYERLFSDKNSSREIREILTQIDTELGGKFVKFRPRWTTFMPDKNNYARQKREVLEFAPVEISRILAIANLPELFAKISQNLNNEPKNFANFRDAIQLSKTLSAMIVRDQDKDIQRKVNFHHSQLSGFANLLSKREIIERYAVQAVNGGQNLLGIDVDSRKYFYKFNEGKFLNIEKFRAVFAKQGNNFRATETENFVKNAEEKPALAVRSSRYQTQFLDWFFKSLTGDFKKRKSSLTAGGSFTIVEIPQKIDWSGEEPRIEKNGEDRIFVSQPFTIDPPENREFSAEKIANRYLGVDVGEFALDWCLIEMDGNFAKILEQGSIADGQQRSVKKDVKDLRNNQVRATFSAPNTKIARVRESLIGSFRNQLESLAIAKNARLTFEYEISHFQTGGRQISVVYDSVKKAEVLRPGNDVDIKQAWGGIKRGLSTKPMLVREFPQYAFEVVAGGTSSFCTNCKRDAYDWLKENDIKGLMGTEVRPDLGQAKWRDFAKEKISEYAEDHANFDVNKALEMVEIHENADVKIREKTSTVDLFICPFCGHITHADKQAAFNIAVRGALKDRLAGTFKDGKIPMGTATREFYTDGEKNLKFAPVEL